MTVEPRPEELEPETKEWLDKMSAVDALNNIADICVDWDGYRTADGLGGLINEIWTYARYCAQKCQEPRVMQFSEIMEIYKADPAHVWPYNTPTVSVHSGASACSRQQ